MEASRVATFFAVVSAVVSVASAGVAVYQAHTAITVPFRSALYSARASALSSFVLASGNLSSALDKAQVALPYDFKQPGSIAADTDEQMLANAIAAEPVISAHGSYLAVANAAIPMWTNATRGQIGISIRASKVAADCFVQLGSHAVTMPKSYWEGTRMRASPSCEHLAVALSEFAESVAAAEGAMISELRRTESEDVPPGNGTQAGGLWRTSAEDASG